MRPDSVHDHDAGPLYLIPDQQEAFQGKVNDRAAQINQGMVSISIGQIHPMGLTMHFRILSSWCWLRGHVTSATPSTFRAPSIVISQRVLGIYCEEASEFSLLDWDSIDGGPKGVEVKETCLVYITILHHILQISGLMV